MMVAEGNSTYLECLPRSRHAAVTWYKQAGENSPELNQVNTRVRTRPWNLLKPTFVWSPGGNGRPAGRHRAGHSNPPG